MAPQREAWPEGFQSDCKLDKLILLLWGGASDLIPPVGMLYLLLTIAVTIVNTKYHIPAPFRDREQIPLEPFVCVCACACHGRLGLTISVGITY